MTSVNASSPCPTPLRAAYALSKKVEAAPGRASVQEILRRLTFLVPNDVPGMHSVGYFGRQRHAQLHGYLIVDQEHKQFSERSMPVHVYPLPDEVRETLRLAHEEICALNRACVCNVIERLPEWERILNPYGLMESLHPSAIVSNDEYSILSSDTISAMAEAFSAHFSFPILADADPIPGVDYVLHEVKRLETEIEYWGAMNSPPYVQAFKKRLAPGLPVRHAFRLVEAIVCLRASLRVLDQMIFQKLKSDKLPCLSDKEIFAVPKLSMHDTGRGMSILFQPVELEHHFKGGELLIVPEIEHHTFPEQILYQVAHASQAMMFSAFSEDGAMGHCQLRPIDENLCPLKEMWSGIYDRTTPDSLMGGEEKVTSASIL